MMAGDILRILGCRTAYKGAMDGAMGREYYISKPLWSSGKIYASGSLSSGLKKREPFCFWKFRGVSLYILSEGSAKLRWVGRVAHLGRGVAQKGVQRSSVGCSIARKDAAYPEGAA